jgi:hypothetical protein
MQTQNVDILINEADQLLNTAEEELQRSEEDVTAYLVCHNSRQSIINYLASYLIKNGVELKQPATMASLMDQCRTVDGRFDLIDISQIFCRHEEHNEDYCLNVEKVSDCLRIAKQTRGITINESPAY